MSIFRTYFTKDTTIIRNSCVNTGKNPIVELFYGGSLNTSLTEYSRYLFDIDFDKLKSKIEENNIDLTKSTHKLYMYNTSCFDSEAHCKTICGYKKRATSFDLTLFKVPEPWDEGGGYDYYNIKESLGNGDASYCEGATNWFDKQTLTNWREFGVYSGSPKTHGTAGDLVIGEQHFDGGDENVCIDITYFINAILTGETERRIIVDTTFTGASISSVKAGNWDDPFVWQNNTVPTPNNVIIVNHEVTLTSDIFVNDLTVTQNGNIEMNTYDINLISGSTVAAVFSGTAFTTITNKFNGFGLAFDYGLESAPLECKEHVGFFGKDTNTIYEPYIETCYTNPIKDDRNNFVVSVDNRLYLYSNGGGKPVNIDSFGDVVIRDHENNIVKTIPASEITQIYSGIYCIELNLPESGTCENVIYTDTWENIVVNGKNLGDIRLEFVTKSCDNFYNIGSTTSVGSSGLGTGSGGGSNTSIYDYAFSVTGIKRKEKIKKGDTRKVFVNARVPITIDQTDILDNIQYRIFIKEGTAQIDIINWMDVNRTTDGNYFLLDTSWMISNDYFLETRIMSGNEIRTYEDVLNFEIVEELGIC